MEQSPLGLWASQSALVYPVANAAHVLGAILLVGSIGLLDLRVLGFARAAPLQALAKSLTPLGLWGFAIMVASGSVMFAADARALLVSQIYWLKLALIGLAGVNALAFRLAWNGRAGTAPWQAQVLALFSLLFWIAVVIAGRWIAYA